MTSLRKKKDFRVFVNNLIKLGYGEVDRELKLWHIAFTETQAVRDRYLKHPCWQTRYYNHQTPASEIIARYEPIMRTLWAPQKACGVKRTRNLNSPGG